MPDNPTVQTIITAISNSGTDVGNFIDIGQVDRYNEEGGSVYGLDKARTEEMKKYEKRYNVKFRELSKGKPDDSFYALRTAIYSVREEI